MIEIGISFNSPSQGFFLSSFERLDAPSLIPEETERSISYRELIQKQSSFSSHTLPSSFSNTTLAQRTNGEEAKEKKKKPVYRMMRGDSDVSSTSDEDKSSSSRGRGRGDDDADDDQSEMTDELW